VSDGLNTKGRIELDVVANVRRAVSELEEFVSTTNKVDASVKNLARGTRSAVDGLDATSKAALGTASANLTSDRAIKANTTSLISQRYALYDVATTYGAIAAALIAVDVLALKVGADFESAYTAVQRTSNDNAAGLEELRGRLLDLSTQIPLTFQDLSKIAALGNQLGIASEDVEAFTGTIARFAAISGISVETVAESFGKISNLTGLPVTDYEKFGSAIALVARESASTETNIISTAKEIAASGENAGFSAQAVVGLAGALASLSIAPERARGSLDTYFGTLNKAVAAGGQDLQNFSTITGIAADEIDRMVRNGQGQEVFAAFLGGLKDLDNVAKTTALKDLNLDQLRVSNTFMRLANGLNSTVLPAFANAEEGFAAGTELAYQYSLVVDDLNSRWMTFTNSVNALIDTLSGGAVSSVADLLAMLTDIVDQAREFSDNPVARNFTAIALASTALIAAYFAVRAASALATASTYALVTAQAALAAGGTTGGVIGLFRALTGGIFGYTTATYAATGATQALIGPMTLAQTRAASLALTMRTLSAALPIIGVALFGNMVANTATQSLQGVVATASLDNAFGSLNDAVAALNDGNLDPFVTNLTKTLNGLDQTGEGFNKFSYDTQKWMQDSLGGLPGTSSTYVSTVDAMTASLVKSDGQLAEMVASGSGKQAAAVIARLGLTAEETAARFPQYIAAVLAAKAAMSSLGGTFNGSSDLSQGDAVMASLKAQIDGVTKSAGGSGGGGGASAALRTLGDYASDLSGVFNRSFSIRFSGGEGLDKITSGWQTIAASIADANLQIAEYRATMLTLTADKAVKEYWLSVAENYGDALRAGQLRAELAQIDVDLTKNSKALTKAQDKNSKTLTGNTEGAIANRAEILGLVSDYQGYITALASSGLSQSALAAKTVALKADFMAQAQQLGYNSAELAVYSASFNDVGTAISRIPRNIDIDFNGDPALTAINEFMSKARASVGGGISIPVYVDDAAVKKYARGQAIIASIGAATGIANNPNEPASRRVLYSDRAANLSAIYNSGQYFDGGYTGDMDPRKAAGIVHGKEFVFSAAATRNIGVDNLAFQHNAAKSGKSYAGTMSGGMGGGMSIVQLSPVDRQLLADTTAAIERGLTFAPSVVQSAVGGANQNASQRSSA
jgi:TP901 family phage tail tape measure protein